MNKSQLMNKSQKTMLQNNPKYIDNSKFHHYTALLMLRCSNKTLAINLHKLELFYQYVSNEVAPWGFLLNSKCMKGSCHYLGDKQDRV